MSLSEFSIRRPVTILMCCLIVLLLGTIAFVKLPVDLMPDVVYPTISVRAEYPGVAPEEMENLVARPLEEAFSSAPGVEEITSTSSEGSTFVRVAFSYGMDLDEAANELRVRLDRRRGALPEDMLPPTMYKFDVSQFPILFLTVAADDMDGKQLRYFVEKQLQYRLERVPGAAQIAVRGGLRREIHVDLDLQKLRGLDLSVARLVQIVRQENLNRPVGPVHEGKYEVLLRTQGEFQNLDEIRNLVVTTRNGVPVYLRDVATVEDSHEEVRQAVSVDGKPAVRLFVYKQSGANTVKVNDAVWEEVARIHKDYPNIHITATGDSAQFIRAAINNVQDSAIQGSILAVAVLLLFLRSFSTTLILGITIPLSIIAAFALMYFAGFTLNTVSFGALALGVGMLVDSGIVVMENIFRHREEGQPPMQAALVGSREVGMAIVASTLTSVVVFVPVLFMQGMSAVTFQQLAWIVTFSQFCSLIAGLSLVPLLCSRFLRVHSTDEAEHGRMGRVFQVVDRAQTRLENRYGNLLEWAILHRKTVVFASIALFGVSLLLMPLVGVELQPETDEGELRVDVELEPGTRVDQTEQVLTRLTRVVRENVPETEMVMIEAGGGGFGRSSGQHMGELRVRLKDRKDRQRSARQILQALRPKLRAGPGVVVRARVSGGMFMRGSRTGSSGGDRLSIEIRGHELDVLDGLAQQVAKAMQSTPGVPDVQLSRQPGMPEMLLSVDRVKAATMGLNVSDIADAMETAVGGRRTSMFRQQGDEYNILVRLREQDRLKMEQVGQVPLSTPLGRTIPAESVVQMRRQEGPVSIDRADQERIVVVSGTLGDRDLGSVVGDLEEKIRQIPRPLGYEIRFGGEYEEQQKSFRELTFAAILALVLVYMVMASQFESLRDPFIILFSVPLASIGVVGTMILTNTTFNMQGFIGVIILVGIVVNNAIILIDYANQLRRDHGYGVRDAVIAAGNRRLRPILMTMFTTCLGLLPMAFGIGEGAELQAPMARVIIGGLTTSTMITLLLIPVVYLMLEERAERIKVRRRAAEAEPLPSPGD